jgi:hypothetical protein
MTMGRNRARNYIDSDPGNIVSADGNTSTYIGGIRTFEVLNLNDHDIEMHMNSDYFKEIRLAMLNNQKPAACKRCYEEEDKGIESKRQYESKNFPKQDYQFAVDNTERDGHIAMDIRFVELRLGNVCNVRCRTCNPASSSRWVKDYEKITESLEFVNDGYSWLDHKHDFQWPEDKSFYEDLYKCAPNMELLYINGGEPTLIKAHWKYLQDLIDADRAKDIILWYNINMTNIPDQAIDIWKQFKETRISASIDDLGDRNHFIRYPTKWSDVEESLAKVLAVPELTVRITRTLSAYNDLYTPDFIHWASKLGVPVDHNPVYDPDFLSPQILPGTDTYDALKWEHFCRYNDELDKIRGQNWRETFPEIVAHCENLGVPHEF